MNNKYSNVQPIEMLTEDWHKTVKSTRIRIGAVTECWSKSSKSNEKEDIIRKRRSTRSVFVKKKEIEAHSHVRIIFIIKLSNTSLYNILINNWNDNWVSSCQNPCYKKNHVEPVLVQIDASKSGTILFQLTEINI